MDTLRAIYYRRSIREFRTEAIDDYYMDEIVRAGLSGPSCVNAQDWEFIVVKDKDTLLKMAEANGPAANPLKGAAAAILVCGNLNESFKPAPDYWIIDCAIAAQNICLAAYSEGIGSVWLGTYPQMERVKAQAKLFDLPKNIVPHSIIALGYPTDDTDKIAFFNVDKIHKEKW